MDQAAFVPLVIPRPDTAGDPIIEIIGHLGAALMQVDSTDDPIIVGHLRDAHSLAIWLLRHPVKESSDAQ